MPLYDPIIHDPNTCCCGDSNYYFVSCDCGYQGPNRKTYDKALVDEMLHRDDHEPEELVG